MDNRNEIATGAERPRNDNGVKPCPVDRGKFLIGLECCDDDVAHCHACPYHGTSTDFLSCGDFIVRDAAAYIGWLEERVKTLETNLTNALGTIERSLDELPPSPYLILCKDEETSKIYVSAEGQPSDFLFLALSGLHKVRMTASLNFYDADAFRKALMDDDGGDCTARNGENAQVLAETKNALADGSKFWKGLEASV